MKTCRLCHDRDTCNRANNCFHGYAYDGIDVVGPQTTAAAAQEKLDSKPKLDGFCEVCRNKTRMTPCPACNPPKKQPEFPLYSLHGEPMGWMGNEWLPVGPPSHAIDGKPYCQLPGHVTERASGRCLSCGESMQAAANRQEPPHFLGCTCKACVGPALTPAPLKVQPGALSYKIVVKDEPKLPTDAKARKNAPMARGLLDYFPLALAAVAELSRVANEQHNPGEPMHWAREKSTDHADCIMRHLVDRGTIDGDGQRHMAKVAWRALAELQLEIERASLDEHQRQQKDQLS